MLDATTAQLVAALDHPNGWWRDQAQKLLVLRQDRSAVPALLAMTRTSPTALSRIHSLWTLEGLDAVDPALIREKLKDPDAYVRAAAIRVSESLFKKGETSLLKPDVQAMIKDPDAFVVLQSAETAKVLKWPTWEGTALRLASNPAPGVQQIAKQLLYEPQHFDGAVFAANQIKLLQDGRAIYQQLCFACHGTDGHGMPMDGQPPGTTLAPPLAGSATVLAPHQSMTAVLLHGVTGPINGRNYDSIMPPQSTNDDEWIASVVSYVRNSFGNHASVVTPEQVAAVRAGTKDARATLVARGTQAGRAAAAGQSRRVEGHGI